MIRVLAPKYHDIGILCINSYYGLLLINPQEPPATWLQHQLCMSAAIKGMDLWQFTHIALLRN